MKHIIEATMILTLLPGTFTFDLNRFFWNRDQSSWVTEEEVQVVEVVRWRQPVCVLPAEGVSPCLHGLRKFQTEYEELSNKGSNAENGDQERLTKLKSTVPSWDEEDSSSEPVSPGVVGSVPLVNLQSSEPSTGTFEEWLPQETLEAQAKTPELTEDQEKNVRGGKRLAARDVSKPQQIYVTKVLDSPVTATLVAHNCLPDIGVPLCDGYQANVRPPKPVLHSTPSLSITAEKPITEQGSPGSLWEDPTDPFFPGNSQQSFSGEPNEPLAEASVPLLKPKPEVVIRKPGSRDPVTSFTVGGSSFTEPPKLQRITMPWGIGHMVPDVGHEPGTVSSLSPSKFNFLEKPTKKLTPDQSVKTELSIEVGKDTEDATKEASNMKESSEAPRQNGSHQVQGNQHPIFHAIHDLVNKTKGSVIVQTLQHLLHRSPVGNLQDFGSATAIPGTLGSRFRPGSVPHRKKDTTTTSKPEVPGDTVEDTPSGEALIEQPLLEVVKTPTFMDILRKPENDISKTPGLLDVFGKLQNFHREPLARPTEKPGLFGYLFANPVRPMEFGNGRVEGQDEMSAV